MKTKWLLPLAICLAILQLTATSPLDKRNKEAKPDEDLFPREVSVKDKISSDDLKNDELLADGSKEVEQVKPRIFRRSGGGHTGLKSLFS